MEIIDPNNISQLLVAFVLALVSIGVGIQVLIKNWKSNTTESSLLTIMHDEIERMHSQNSSLSEEIGKLQVELIKLSTQLTTLTLENQKLQAEVSNLNKEIARLHVLMSNQIRLGDSI